MRAAAVGALGLYAISATAQETGGLQMYVDVNEQLAYDTNNSLEPGGEENTSSSTTTLTFGLTSETRTDKLSASLGGVLRVVSGPGRSGTEAEIDDPTLRFSFARDTGNASFDIGANYQRTPVDFTRPLSDFFDPDTGLIVLPDDLDDLEGRGNRTSIGANVEVELFKNAPAGLTLRASKNILRYSDTTDSGLFRTERTNFGADVRLTFSDVLEGTGSVSRSTYEAEDDDQTDRVTDKYSFGLEYSASSRLTLEGRVGYSRTETDEGIGPARMTSVEDGATFRFAAEYDLANGSMGATLTSDVDQNARRNTLEFNRSFDLPDGDLSASIGVTRGSADNTEVIGSLNWSKELPTGVLSAQVSRSVTTSNDDDERLSTALTLNYAHTINELSSISLTTTLVESDLLTGGDSASRFNASATYSYELTQDWDLNAGYTYRRNKDEGQEVADSHSIFLGVGRRFNLRP